jgi:uncharacterized membrane protein
MLEKSPGRKKFGTRQITIIGMLSAISIVLGATGIGFIPLPIVKATFMHVPVIIGALIEGPIVGLCIGVIFGIFSIIQNITNPSLLFFAFINPLVSVLPRALIGITTYYSYKLPFLKKEVLKIGLGAAIGSLTNTVGVLGAIYLLYADKYASATNISVDAAGKAILGVAVVNGLPEALIAVLITIPIVLAVRGIRKR